MLEEMKRNAALLKEENKTLKADLGELLQEIDELKGALKKAQTKGNKAIKGKTPPKKKTK